MNVGKEDLSLKLSLGFAKSEGNNTNTNTNTSLHGLNSMVSSVTQKPSWLNDQVFPSSDRNSDSSRMETTTARPFLGGIDVNRLPSTAECEEEVGVSSPNSTVSSTMSGKRNGRHATNNESEELHENRGISDEEDGDTSRKKLRLSKDQSAVLEESFKEHSTLNPKQKLALAKQLGLRSRQVEVWFQNRRARTKLKQTEVDCEFLKRCYENLTEENRRLQREVQELRALKLSPQFYMQRTPPTTLTMCPSCERVGVPPPSTVVDPRQSHRHLGHLHHRPIAINPWVSAAREPFDSLHSRS